jgi:hypothetical protein
MYANYLNYIWFIINVNKMNGGAYFLLIQQISIAAALIGVWLIYF